MVRLGVEAVSLGNTFPSYQVGADREVGYRKDTVLGVLHRARGWSLTEFYVGLLAITKQMYIKKRE